MKKVFLLLIGFILISTIAVFLYFTFTEHVITIPEETIQEKIDTQLPVTKNYLFIFDVTLDNPRVNLLEGSNRINAGLDVYVNIKINEQDKTLGGTVDASGSLVYVAEEGAFYLSEPIIESLSVQGVPEKYTDIVSSAIEKLLVGFYSSRPVYKLKPTDIKQAAAKNALKSLVVRDQAMVVTLGI